MRKETLFCSPQDIASHGFLCCALCRSLSLFIILLTLIILFFREKSANSQHKTWYNEIFSLFSCFLLWCCWPHNNWTNERTTVSLTLIVIDLTRQRSKRRKCTFVRLEWNFLAKKLVYVKFKSNFLWIDITFNYVYKYFFLNVFI